MFPVNSAERAPAARGIRRKINIVGMKGPSQCFLGRSFLLQRVIPDYG